MKRSAAKGGAAKKRVAARDVKAYLAAAPPRQRAALQKLRQTIKAAAPKAVEVISYQVPMFKHQGPLVSFAAFPNHCSFFVMSPAVMRAHKEELEPYETSTGTIRFTAERPLPASLVKKLVRARIEENEARKKR